MIDATNLHWNLDNLPRDGKTLSWTFYSRGPANTTRLAQAFAAVVCRPPEPDKVTRRIGIVGSIGAGKSAFANGLLDTVPDRVKLETRMNCYGRVLQSQALWHSPSQGWFRHYDVLHFGKESCLSSYWNNDTSGFVPLVDIVEHAASDKNDKMFDYLIGVKGLKDQPREITVVTTPELAETEAFRTFLQIARHISFT